MTYKSWEQRPEMAEEARPRRKHRAGLSRIAIACERCREKKNKCDGATPVCSQCRRSGAECIVVDRLTHRPQARGHVDALERENEELRKRIRLLEQNIATFSGPHGVATPLSTPTVPGNESETPGDVSLERTAFDHPTGSSNTFVGESGGSFFSTLVDKTLIQSGYQDVHGPLHSSLKLDLNNQVASDRTTFFDHFGQINDSVLPAELIFKLEESFFDHRWPSLPFLHRPAFRRQHLGVFLENREQANPTSVFLVLMVSAMGAIDLARYDRSLKDLPILCFAVAMGHHFDKAMRNEGLETIQCLLLVAWFSMNRSCGINAWHAAGQAMRAAIALGLHRESTHNTERLSVLQREMRKRIFWSAYSIDRNVSLALGRPPAIRDADINVEIPECLTDDDLLTNVEPLDRKSCGPMPHDISAFIHIVHLRRLRSRIQDTLYPAKVSLTDTEIQQARAAMHQELDTWAASAPRYNQAKVLTFQTNEWFQITYSQSLLLLYRPSPACPVANQEALHICAENAISLITSYSSLYAKNKMSYTWITVHSLLMASITMLYTLWVSPAIRDQTTPSVVESNIKQCLMLFEVMQETWPLAARCRNIVKRFGNAALGLWHGGRMQQTAIDGITSSTQQIGNDYAAWFSVHTNGPAAQPEPDYASTNAQTTLTADTDAAPDFEMINDFDNSIFQDFDINLPLMMDAFNDNTA